MTTGTNTPDAERDDMSVSLENENQAALRGRVDNDLTTTRHKALEHQASPTDR